jgi:hypothetical protein
MFLLEVVTRSGRISEAFPTYDAALARLNALSDEELLSMPLIFQELPDGSQRIVRADGKPLQAHRPTLAADPSEDSLPLAEEEIPLGEVRAIYTPQEDSSEWVDPLGRVCRRADRSEDDPLPLAE